MAAREVVARIAHVIPDRPPLEVRPGERVHVGERDTTWPAFVFLTCAGGSGWVTERHLDAGRPVAAVVAAYTTRELATPAGDRLTVLQDDPGSGWSWCRDGRGREGWVPHSTLR